MELEPDSVLGSVLHQLTSAGTTELKLFCKKIFFTLTQSRRTRTSRVAQIQWNSTLTSTCDHFLLSNGAEVIDDWFWCEKKQQRNIANNKEFISSLKLDNKFTIQESSSRFVVSAQEVDPPQQNKSLHFQLSQLWHFPTRTLIIGDWKWSEDGQRGAATTPPRSVGGATELQHPMSRVRNESGDENHQKFFGECLIFLFIFNSNGKIEPHTKSQLTNRF